MSKKRVCSRVPLTVALVIAVLALAPTAFAAGASDPAESSGAVPASVQSDAKSRPAGATADSAGLPFSGLDATMLLGGGALLLGSGVLLGRLRSRRGTV